MKGKKKQLLGFFGLALVFAMTAIAYSLPAPEAAAQDLNVSVTVVAEEGSANITKPLEGEVFTGRTTNVEVPHAHEHHIGQRIHGRLSWLRRGRNAENLVDYLRGCKIRLEAEFTRGAEIAVHLAARLRRDAKRGTVVIRNIDRLYRIPVTYRKKVFHGAVGRFH